MTTIRQLAAWYETRIARLITTEGLHVGLMEVVQGPLTLTYKVRLLQPTRQALTRLLGLGPALAATLQAEGVRVSQAQDAVHIEIPLPTPARRTPTAIELVQCSRGLTVCVGYDQFRRPVSVDLRQHGALFWIGPSRRGKTQSMKSALFALAVHNRSRLFYAILSQKRTDWQAFTSATGCMGLVSQPAEALHVLTWAVNVLQQRAETGTGGAHLVLVADDLLNLLAQEPALAGQLAEIASMGAGLGVHLFAGTQEGGSKRGTGGAGVENNATAKILYRSSSAAAAARATGQGSEGVQQLSGAKGDALLLLDGQPTRIATGLADDRAILQMDQGARVSFPWRSDNGTAGVGQGVHTGTGPNGVPPSLSGHPAVPLPYVPPTKAPYSAREGGQEAAVRISTTLPDLEPDADARSYLRRLYAEHASKNKVLQIAWGGVINDTGKTPKTLRWLQQALEETPDIDSAPDFQTLEGLAAIERLVTEGRLTQQEVISLLPEQIDDTPVGQETVAMLTRLGILNGEYITTG